MGDITACRNVRRDHVDRVVRTGDSGYNETVNLQCEANRNSILRPVQALFCAVNINKENTYVIISHIKR
jgi:hypothetical protein